MDATAPIVACPHCAGLNRVPTSKPSAAARCGKCGTALFQGKPIALTAETAPRHWDKADLPVLVDFWAEWCGPCRSMAPVLDQAAQAFEPKLRVAKVNTEDEQALAAAYGIRSIPTMVLVHKGQEVARISGAMPLASLKQWLEQHVDL